MTRLRGCGMFGWLAFASSWALFWGWWEAAAQPEMKLPIIVIAAAGVGLGLWKGVRE